MRLPALLSVTPSQGPAWRELTVRDHVAEHRLEHVDRHEHVAGMLLRGSDSIAHDERADARSFLQPSGARRPAVDRAGAVISLVERYSIADELALRNDVCGPRRRIRRSARARARDVRRFAHSTASPEGRERLQQRHAVPRSEATTVAGKTFVGGEARLFGFR